MNSRATASVSAIKKALPFEPPDELLLFIIFGSQVRNEETPESDLDILCVTRTESKQFYESLHETMAGARDGVRGATVLSYTPRTIGRNANLYGMPEYGALRGYHNGESDILYRSDDACDVLDGIMAGGVGGCCGDEDGHNERDVCDTDWCAEQWLDKSEKAIADGLSWVEKHGTVESPDAAVACRAMHDSINYSIRACLLHHNIMFPFTRDVRELYRMLPTGSRVPLDLDALHHWSGHSAGRAPHGGASPSSRDHTPQDADGATRAARRAYDLVSKELSYARPKPGSRRRMLENIKHIPTMPKIFIMPSDATAAAPRA